MVAAFPLGLAQTCAAGDTTAICTKSRSGPGRRCSRSVEKGAAPAARGRGRKTPGCERHRAGFVGVTPAGNLPIYRCIPTTLPASTVRGSLQEP